MITGNWQRIWQTGKHRFAIMRNNRCFAMQDFTRLANVPAVGFNNRLVAEADTDNRQFAAQASQ
ncbi:hypothetical protein D3C75_647630 [compost metagenome]